ncbi:MAG: dockerin type I repeat-containing protein [candidate division Zixibacteria bacterium]|nr:dockerin type I repeat-containing protein [candidate division Zixibacteria bacterium]
MFNRVETFAILILLCLCINASCPATTTCGDANGDGTINLGDPIYLINYIFRGGQAPDPLGKCDVNYDGNVNIGDAVWLVRYVFAGDFPPICPPFACGGQSGECKIFNVKDAGSNAECAEWIYDGESMLSILHINAGFNCCPGELTFDIDVTDNIITVTEMEEDEGCDCLCLFDVSYDIIGIEPGVYTLIIDGPYTAYGANDPLEFSIDLTASGNGEYCVPRSHYPWNVGGASGSVSDYGECKVDKVIDSTICLNWFYDGAGTLLLTHINSLANCCVDSLYADITITGSDIAIVEYEDLEGGGCYCNCLYDVDFVLTNITPGEITVTVQCIYCDPEETFEVTIDLINDPEGSFCLE